MEKELEEMDTTNPFVKDVHQEVMESVKVSLIGFLCCYYEKELGCATVLGNGFS